MSVTSIIFLMLAALLVWGGLIASVIFLSMRPEVAKYPHGGEGNGTDSAGADDDFLDRAGI